jgi:hypothetical protein
MWPLVESALHVGGVGHLVGQLITWLECGPLVSQHLTQVESLAN